MSCKLIQSYVPAYLDGELDVVRKIEMEEHIVERCADCAGELESLRSLRAALRGNHLAYAAPAALRERILSALPSAPAGELPNRRRPWRLPPIWQWAAGFAVLAICAVAAWRILPGLGRGSDEQRIAAEVLSSHLRSLEADHLSDIVSTDQHTVNPWFNGKLDFSPPVEDLASDGFPLVGGRLDYLDGRAVAALVYRRRLHIINVFVWPGATRTGPACALTPRQGYNTTEWARGGFHFWAISDVNPSDLADLARLLQSRIAP